jgi:hypothetical protein
MQSPAQPSSGIGGWLPVWIKVFTKPSEQTFLEITQGPQAVAKTAFLWVFLIGTLSTIVSGLLTAILTAAGFSASRWMSAVEKITGTGGGEAAAGASVGGLLLTVCASPLFGAFAVVGFTIGVAIIQWTAKLFGGVGTFAKLAYAVGAVNAPIGLISMVLAPLGALPIIGVCTGFVQLGIVVYSFILEVLAIRAVHGLGWIKALASIFIIPGVLILCSCLVIGALMLSGPAIGDIFSGINSSLVGQ